MEPITTASGFGGGGLGAANESSWPLARVNSWSAVPSIVSPGDYEPGVDGPMDSWTDDPDDGPIEL